MPDLSATPPAIWRRLAAMLYDSFLVIAISMLYGTLITAVHSLIFGAADQNYQPINGGIPFLAGWFASIALFFCFFWFKTGQTVGMKAWKLKLVSSNGESLTLSQCCLRFIYANLSFLLLGLGFVWMSVDKNKRALHDHLSHSHPIQEPS